MVDTKTAYHIDVVHMWYRVVHLNRKKDSTMPEVLIPDDHDLIVLLATRYVLAHDDEDESIRVAKYIIRVLNDLRTETVKNLCNYIGDVMRYGSRPASGDLQDVWWNVWEKYL